jgi:hypothetical protein
MEACAMTYREQDPSAAQARIGELERENKKLRDGRIPIREKIVIAGFLTLLAGLFAAVSSVVYSCAEGEDECMYQCATQGGECLRSATSGVICQRKDGDETVPFTVPRRPR